VITPRRTQLIRVPGLHAFRQVIANLVTLIPEPGALSPEPGTLNPEPVLVVVPTRGAARQLQRALDGPDIVTRDELYDRLHDRLTNPPRRLSALERDVIIQGAARAAAVGGELSFQLRPGLIAEMLRFYDHLRRQSQQVKRFEELIDEALGLDDADRAAERLRKQTRFLAGAFREYERRVRDSGGCDEHTLRERLMAEPSADPIRHVIVTVADWIADADGLYAADFDLLTRIPGLEALDIVSTERVLASGFHERLHTWWPGLEEVSSPGVVQAFGPALITPPDASTDEPWWTLRDREEELVAIARRLKADKRTGDAVPLARTAVVFKRPLPYLYLAAEVFRAAGIPYQSSDALPLAAEPTAAAIDLVLETVAADFSRGTLVALLRSPHFTFGDGDADVTRESVSALDRALSQARYLGDLDRLEALATDWHSAASFPALHAALAAARELAPLATSLPASTQIARLLAFWSAHSRPIADDDPYASRERRARAAVVDMLSALTAVHTAHDDPPWTVDDVGIAVRRWIGEQTFVQQSAGAGLFLLDDRAVRYGDFDDVAIVGVIEPDWPERPRRNIFYPPSLLKSLGWPSERDRRAADDGRFLDLLGCASRRTIVSTFTLDEDALVSRSMQLDEIPRARLSTVAGTPFDNARIFADEALAPDRELVAVEVAGERIAHEERGREVLDPAG